MCNHNTPLEIQEVETEKKQGLQGSATQQSRAKEARTQQGVRGGDLASEAVL